MAIKINKGGDLGKYFYAKNDVTYGPIKLDELLQRVDEDTLVFYDGIDWTPASEIPELKKFVHKTSGPVKQVAPVNQVGTENTVEAPKAKSNAALIWVLLILGAVAAFYFINKNNSSTTVVPTVDTAAYLPDTAFAEPEILEPVDAYTSVLSVSQLTSNQLDNVLLSDLITYQNDILARHGYIFESQSEIDHYKANSWYSPVNNYLSATSSFSDIEKYNFNAIQEKLNVFSTEIRTIVTSYFQSISDKSFDATNFFAEKVDNFITKKNVTPWDINEEMRRHYDEFIDSKFTFAEDFEITYHESAGGINYVSFKGFFEAYRASKNKNQECIVTIKMGLNRNNKIVFYKEEKIENLKFTEVTQ